MKKIELPRGTKYRIEKSKAGIIIPGTDSEPIISVFGRGSMIQYRLVSCALRKESIIEDTYSAGNLDDEEIETIDSWVEHLIPSLLREAGVKHTIKFQPSSDCYYDFDAQILHGATGYKEKKGTSDDNRENAIKLNGKPCRLTKSEESFIALLTRTPNALFSREEVADDAGLSLSSMNQKWNVFGRYDTSIKETFLRENGMFVYRGAPQTWQIGEGTIANSITLQKIFEIVGRGAVSATFNNSIKQIAACLNTNIDPNSVMNVLGLQEELLHLPLLDKERFVVENYCSSISDFTDLLNRYCISLEAVWKQLHTNISESLTLSLRASTYYQDTGEMPIHLTDLKGYSITPERLERALLRTCPAVKELIEDTCVGADFFSYCDISVSPDSLVDYIAALILTCLCYCKTAQEDRRLSQEKMRYQNKLTSLIRKRFNYSPPGEGKETIMEELQKLALEAQLALNDGNMDIASSKVSKINDLLNSLGYNDANSLISSSMGKNH